MTEVDGFYDDVQDQSYNMVMYLVEPDGSQKERRLTYKAKGEYFAITHFHYPDSVNGMGFLQEPGDNMHVYLPEFQKVRKVAAHTKRQSFMGSDFSYHDMNNERYTHDYDAELVDDSGDSYIVKLTPKPGVDIEYSKLMLTVEPGTFMIDTIEFYDEGGQKVKLQTREDAVKLDNIWMQRKITMEDLRSHHKTVLLLQDIKLNTGISDDEFSVRNLRRVN
ncbi:MAG: outer membrane lipoprotein-sorting protein [Acidobacteriota bacterium]